MNDSIIITKICKDYKPGTGGICHHLEEEDYGTNGVAKSCTLRKGPILIQDIFNCPMSTTKIDKAGRTYSITFTNEED